MRLRINSILLLSLSGLFSIGADAAVIRVQSETAQIELIAGGDPTFCNEPFRSQTYVGSLFFGSPFSRSLSSCGVSVSATGTFGGTTFLVSPSAGGGSYPIARGIASINYTLVFDVLGGAVGVQTFGDIARVTEVGGGGIPLNSLDPDKRYQLTLYGDWFTGIGPTPARPRGGASATFTGEGLVFDVPEPATLSLLAFGLAIVMACRLAASERRSIRR